MVMTSDNTAEHIDELEKEFAALKAAASCNDPDWLCIRDEILELKADLRAVAGAATKYIKLMKPWMTLDLAKWLEPLIVACDRPGVKRAME